MVERLKMKIFFFFFPPVFCIFFRPQVLYNDPAALQYQCWRCRIRTRDLCLRSLASYQWATTSLLSHHISRWTNTSHMPSPRCCSLYRRGQAPTVHNWFLERVNKSDRIKTIYLLNVWRKNWMKSSKTVQFARNVCFTPPFVTLGILPTDAWHYENYKIVVTKNPC